MSKTPLSNLWSDLWTDLYNPGLLWQICVIVMSLALGWALARMLRGRLTAHEVQLRAVRLGVESFSRVLSPLIALVLIILAKSILAQWHQVNLLSVAIPLVGSFALIRLTFYVLRRVFAHGGNVGSVVLLFEKLFAIMIWAGVALYITGLWTDMLVYLEQTVIPIGRYKTSLLTILQAAASVAVTLIVALWAGAILEERLMRLDTMHSSLRAVMARLGRASLILIAILVSLSLVGIDLTVLSVFGGALGVGLGLGLQKIVSSYVSGFVILLERSLAIGDMVTVDKYYGQVTRINTRYTIVRSLDGIESVIPNEMLVASPVQNYSLSDSRLRVATHVTVGYQTDIDHVSQLLVAAVARVSRVLQDPLPQVLLMKFGADGLELEIGFWFADPENGRSNLLSEVNRAIWKVLQAHQINVPYPQREYRILDSRPKEEGKVEPVALDIMSPANKR
jgi:small-conductance mechanosensitive channel